MTGAGVSAFSLSLPGCSLLNYFLLAFLLLTYNIYVFLFLNVRYCLLLSFGRSACWMTFFLPKNDTRGRTTPFRFKSWDSQKVKQGFRNMHLKEVKSLLRKSVLQHLWISWHPLSDISSGKLVLVFKNPGNHPPCQNWVTLRHFALASSSEMKVLDVTDGLTVPMWGN